MSQTCQVYTREIRTPVEIRLTVEMTAGGMIDHIDGDIHDDVSVTDDLRVRRAVGFLSEVILALQEQGSLIEDALLNTPPTADFAIERSILKALAELQYQVMSPLVLSMKRGRAA